MHWMLWREWMRDNKYMTLDTIPLLKDRANCKIAFLKAPCGVWLEPQDEEVTFGDPRDYPDELDDIRADFEHDRRRDDRRNP